MFISRNEYYNGAMEMSDLFNLLHNAVEAQNNGKKISQKELAQTLGISMRTYQDWKLGNAKPQAAKAVIQMLGMLEDDEIVRVVRKINTLDERNHE
jgi:DNA-binding XRE family transcriptional regulator